MQWESLVHESQWGSRCGRSGSHIQNELRTVMEPENSSLVSIDLNHILIIVLGKLLSVMVLKHGHKILTLLPMKVMMVVRAWGGFMVSLLE